MSTIRLPGIVALCLLALSVALPRTLQAGEPAGGTVSGILVAKGETWIEVKADGAAEAVKYIPFWRGGLPKDGGGFDKEMLETIKTLAAGNRVTLTWKMEEHRRIVSIKQLAPAGKSGTVGGEVADRGDNWIDVKAASGDVERYMPKWVGGAPKDGGGFDKDMVKKLAGFKAGDKVTIKWIYDERKRVVEIDAAGDAGK
ncbi:MAG: hypothetical protein C0404_09425 [Verrucomicrobia bacterium]|nr:hypothetical protein [Verrucomicrobiota bacterium]